MINDIIENAKLCIQNSGDLKLLVESGHAIHRDLNAVLSAAEKRIEQEKARDAAEIENLKKQLADPSRAKAVKLILQQQIEELQNRTYPILEVEKQTYQELEQEYRDTLADGNKTVHAFKDTFEKLGTQLSELRTATLKNAEKFDLMANPYGLNKQLKAFEEQYGQISKYGR